MSLLVKAASDLHVSIGVRIASIIGRHQQPIGLIAVLVQVRRDMMTISQDEPHIFVNFAQQAGVGSLSTILARACMAADGNPDGPS